VVEAVIMQVQALLAWEALVALDTLREELVTMRHLTMPLVEEVEEVQLMLQIQPVVRGLGLLLVVAEEVIFLMAQQKVQQVQVEARVVEVAATVHLLVVEAGVQERLVQLVF
jgi:hypothetical protein